MKLLSVHVENFGRLCDYDRDFTSGFNKISEKNGWGKTTFTYFLLAMFYGFDDRATKKLREHFAPWNGGYYGGSIVFETSGKTYTIERSFGTKRATDDKFLLRNAETNMESSDFDEYIGDELFGINAESFMKTVFIGNEGCRTSSTDDISAKIGDVSLIESDMRSFSEAQKSLKDYINKNSDERKTGALSGLRNEINDLRVKARFAQEIRKELLDCDNVLSGLESEKTILESQNEEINSLQSLVVKCKEAVLHYEKYKVLLNAFENAYKAKQEESSVNVASQIVLFLLGILLAIFGIFISLYHNLFGGIALIFAGIVLLVISMVLVKKNGQKLTERENEKEARYLEAESEFNNFTNSINLDEVKELASLPEATFSLKDTDKTRKEIVEKLDGIAKDIVRLERRREFLMEELSIAESAGEKADSMEEQYAVREKDLKYARLATDFLERAKTDFSLRYLEPIRDNFNDYYSFVSGKKEVGCHLDTDLKLTIDEAGAQRSEDCFSDGLRDIFGLCLRFSLIDAMYVSETPFIVMDDPFIHLDSETEKLAYELIGKMDYQIIMMEKC